MPGLFDLIQSAIGRPDPTAQLYAALQGQSGGPGAAAGPPPPAAAPGAAPGAPGAPQAQPVPQALQSPPDMAAANAKLAQGAQQQQPQVSPTDYPLLYLQMVQRQRASDDFNRGLAGMLGGFKGPPGGAQQIMNSVGAPSGQDPGAFLQNFLTLRNQGALQSSVPAMLQKAGLDPSYAPLAIANPDFLAKVVEAQTGVGADLETRQYLAAQKAAQAAGQPFPDIATWKAQHATAAAVGTTAGQDKLDATSTFPSLDPQYKTAEDTVQWLNSHPDATVKAVQWGSAANGRVGQMIGGLGLLDQDTQDARAKIDQLNDENFRAGLANVKNVRSQSEANKVGGAVSSLDKPANSPQMITSELGRLTNVIQGARGNLMGAAGKQIPLQYEGLVDPSYLDPKNPLYNGSSLAGQDPSDSDLQAARAYIATHPNERNAVIEHFHDQGFRAGAL